MWTLMLLAVTAQAEFDDCPGGVRQDGPDGRQVVYHFFLPGGSSGGAQVRESLIEVSEGRAVWTLKVSSRLDRSTPLPAGARLRLQSEGTPVAEIKVPGEVAFNHDDRNNRLWFEIPLTPQFATTVLEAPPFRHLRLTVDDLDWTFLWNLRSIRQVRKGMECALAYGAKD